MADISTGSTSVEFGATLRIGYRIAGSLNPFSYTPYFPSYNELPYTFSVPSPGQWEVEYTQICSGCSGASYSAPKTKIVTVY